MDVRARPADRPRRDGLDPRDVGRDPGEGGPWRGRYCIGSSLAVGSDGGVLARLPYGVDAEAFQAIDVPLAA